MKTNKMTNLCYISYGSWDYLVESPVAIKKGDYIFFAEWKDGEASYNMEGQALCDSFLVSEDAYKILKKKDYTESTYVAHGRRESFC